MPYTFQFLHQPDLEGILKTKGLNRNSETPRVHPCQGKKVKKLAHELRLSEILQSAAVPL